MIAGATGDGAPVAPPDRQQGKGGEDGHTVTHHRHIHVMGCADVRK